jgi:hypothetical protein
MQILIFNFVDNRDFATDMISNLCISIPSNPSIRSKLTMYVCMYVCMYILGKIKILLALVHIPCMIE